MPTTFSVGQPFPRAIPNHEGAIAEFLNNNDNTLYIFFENMHPTETEAFRRGRVRAGQIVRHRDILLLWQFIIDDQTVAALESPFDTQLVPVFTPPELIRANDRMVINIIAVDSATKRVVTLRSITFPPELSRQFVNAAKAQRTGQTDLSDGIKTHDFLPHELIHKTTMYELGQ